MSSIYSEVFGPGGYASSLVDFLAQGSNKIAVTNNIETVTLCGVANNDPFQSERSTQL